MDIGEIAFFGGTFDPPHIGHKKIIELCKKKFKQIIISPNKFPPCNIKKKPIASSIQRLEMLELMFPETNVIIDDYELNSDTKSYTYYTLKYLINKYELNSITLILGQDQLNSIKQWYKSDWIINNVEILCFTRGEYKKKYFDKVSYIAFDYDISSSMIRNKIIEKQNVSVYLDDFILEYIQQKRIY